MCGEVVVVFGVVGCGVDVEEMMMLSVVDGGDDVCGGVVMKVGRWLCQGGCSVGDGHQGGGGDGVRMACRGDGGDDVGCGGGWPESGQSGAGKS
nr:hypothetical protein [Tanacetum cinerariifolium]